MLTQRLPCLFRELVGTFKAYQDARRDPDYVLELTAARADLGDIRVEIFEDL